MKAREYYKILMKITLEVAIKDILWNLVVEVRTALMS